MAIGFSIGLIGVPIVLTISLITFQAFIFSFMGLKFGMKLKLYLGEWAEKLAGIVLGLLGVCILIDAIIPILRI
jgi:putative Mn2+ efflux pump MntP